MQAVSDSSVLGDFNNTKYKSQGITSTFFKNGEYFYLNTEGPEGTYEDFKVEYVFGIELLQQYIVEFPNGHYQCLRTAWDTEKVNNEFDTNFKITADFVGGRIKKSRLCFKKGRFKNEYKRL